MSELTESQYKEVPQVDDASQLRLVFVNPDDGAPQLCGLGNWRPRWLQRYYNKRYNLALMCGLAFLQTFFVTGVTHTVYSTLERRYQMSSYNTAWMSSSYDISSGSLSGLLSYFGTRRHKPRWLLVSTITFCLACVVITLPELLSDSYSIGESSMGGCAVRGDSLRIYDCEKLSPDKHYIFLFYLAMVIFGTGGCLVWTIGPAFIDDSVNNKESPKYLAFYYISAALGAAVGTISCGLTLKLYVNPLNHPAELTSPNDPRWVGAWWLCYVFGAISFFVLAALFSLYTEELPETASLRAAALKEKAVLYKTKENSDPALLEDTSTVTSSTNRKSHQSALQLGLLEALRSTRDLMMNLRFMLISLGVVCNAFVIAGLSSFLPKVVENQFNLPADKAGICVGVTIMITICSAIISSGYVGQRFEPNIASNLALVLVCNIILMSAGFFTHIYCPSAQLYGVNTLYPTMPKNTTLATPQLDDTCNSGCNCDTTNYAPVCDTDNHVQYFSSCHAGCSAGNLSACSCQTTPSTLVPGVCDNTCYKLWWYLAIVGVGLFAGFFAKVPVVMLTMRSVDISHRAYALGFQATLWKLLGTIPAPLILGQLLDSVCVLPYAACDTTQGSANCWLYDNDELARTMKAYIMCGQAAGVLLFGIAFLAELRHIGLRFWENPPLSPATEEHEHVLHDNGNS